MEKIELERRNGSFIKMLTETRSHVKKNYELAALNPEEENQYRLFEEDEPLPYKHNGFDVKIKKGNLVSINNEDVDWTKITAKYRTITNDEFFRIMSNGYISKEALVLYSERNEDFKENYKVDGLFFKELIEKILVPFGRDVLFELADYEKMKEFVETDEDVVRFFNDEEEGKPEVKWELLSKLPTSIILFYLVKNHRDELVEKWMFGEEELKELLSVMNINE